MFDKQQYIQHLLMCVNYQYNVEGLRNVWASGLHMNGVRSHAHAPTHAINLIRRAIIAHHGFKYFTYGVRRAHTLNTNHRHIARLEYKSKT